MNTPNETMSKPGAAWKQVQRAVTLGVFAALPLVGTLPVSQAAPPPHAPAWGYRNNKDDRWDRRHDRRDDRKDRWDDRKDRRDRRDDRRDDCRDDRWDRRDGRWNQRGHYGYPNHGNPGYGYPNHGNPNYGNPNYGNPNYGNPGYNYPGYGNGYGYGQQSFTGVVTDVHSATSFDIRVGGDTYNVYLTSRAPRYLNVGDVVRVYGERANKNDIRGNSVTILNNR